MKYDERRLKWLWGPRLQEKVLGYIDRALAAGLRSVTGDGRCELPAALAGGSFVKPVVFVDVGDAQADSPGRVCHYVLIFI